jgi:spore maturation protein B
VVIFALFRRASVFDLFLKGAKEGVMLLYNIAPTIIGLVFAVDLLRSSGAVDNLCSFIEPAADFLGFPKEIVPMVLLRPVSGSGSTALLTALYDDCGPDSFAGRVASVLAGSSETTFYAIAMYFGSIKVKKIRHTLFAALMADLTAGIMSVITVKLILQ